jgi:hypothetical protein
VRDIGFISVFSVKKSLSFNIAAILTGSEAKNLGTRR